MHEHNVHTNYNQKYMRTSGLDPGVLDLGIHALYKDSPLDAAARVRPRQGMPRPKSRKTRIPLA